MAKVTSKKKPAKKNGAAAVPLPANLADVPLPAAKPRKAVRKAEARHLTPLAVPEAAPTLNAPAN